MMTHGLGRGEDYDVNGEDVTGGSTNGATGDEAAWQDLVARYDMPGEWDAAAVPWPEREDLPAPRAPGSDAPRAPSSDAPPPAGPADHPHAGSADRTRVVRPALPPHAPVPSAGCPGAGPDGIAAPAGPPGPSETDDADGHYVPPLPPPLPHLDSVAKGAWTALFGGPAYLLAATLAGWSVPGWAALLAIAAFVGGFVVLVLRLGDGPSRGSGPDNGAVL
jgi:hypothetical protein